MRTAKTRNNKRYTEKQENRIVREMRSARNPERKLQSLANSMGRSIDAIRIKHGRLTQ